MQHGDYDGFWKNHGSSAIDQLAEYKGIPVLHTTGRYDSGGNQVANLNCVELRRTKKSPQRIYLGPWTHGGQTRSFSGEAEFGPETALDSNAIRLRWFEQWFKGVDEGVDREAAVRVFVMGDGAGFWLCKDSRPLAARNDVFVFRTPLLDHDIEVTGRLVVKLRAWSNAVDTDRTAKLYRRLPAEQGLPSRDRTQHRRQHENREH